VKLKIIPKNDRDVFHKDKRVNKVVDLLLKDDTLLYKEIINVINNIFNFRDFSNHIQILYNLYAYPELSDKLGIYITSLWNIYSDTNCSNLRGALLEKLVCKLLENKYVKDYESHISCYICINSWRSSKSVDVLFYIVAEDIGDSIECKVNPHNLEKSHIENLKEIFIKSDKKIYPSIVSFSSRKALELKIKEFKIPFEPVQLYGSENLKEIAMRSLSIPT
jgi:hypothetical protein